MGKSIRVITNRKKRAPVTGTLVGVRIQPEMLARIDALRSKSKPKLSRPEAIRMLIVDALKLSKG